MPEVSGVTNILLILLVCINFAICRKSKIGLCVQITLFCSSPIFLQMEPLIKESTVRLGKLISVLAEKGETVEVFG